MQVETTSRVEEMNPDRPQCLLEAMLRSDVSHCSRLFLSRLTTSVTQCISLPGIYLCLAPAAYHRRRHGTYTVPKYTYPWAPTRMIGCRTRTRVRVRCLHVLSTSLLVSNGLYVVILLSAYRYSMCSIDNKVTGLGILISYILQQAAAGDWQCYL